MGRKQKIKRRSRKWEAIPGFVNKDIPKQYELVKLQMLGKFMPFFNDGFLSLLLPILKPN